MFTETFTLFNFCKATGLWYLSVISGAILDVDMMKNHGGNGLSNGEDIFILVKCGADRTMPTEDGSRAYLGPKAYAKCESPESYYTFTPECDFVYHGIWESLDTIDDDDYESGLYHYLNNEYDDIHMISNAKFYGLLPHWEIGAK